MPSNDSPDDTKSDPLNLAVKAIVQHEKELSRIIAKIDSKKDEISTGMKKLNESIDNITVKIDILEIEIAKLRTIFPA